MTIRVQIFAQSWMSFFGIYGEYADLAEHVKNAAAQLEDAHRLFIGDGEKLPGIIGQMREVSGREIQAVRETQTRLDALSRDFGGFESRVSRLIEEVATDAFLDDQAKQLLERISKEISLNVLKSILDKSVYHMTRSLDKETRELAAATLAKFNANSAIELSILFEEAKKDFAREIGDVKSRAAIEVREAQAEQGYRHKILEPRKKILSTLNQPMGARLAFCRRYPGHWSRPYCYVIIDYAARFVISELSARN